MKTLDAFKDISLNMLWRQAALDQLAQFEALGLQLDCKPIVVEKHCSKSIELPVVLFKIGPVNFLVRDNFHDINVCVLADQPIQVPYTTMFRDIYAPRDWVWYLEEVTRARNYNWREWSDTEMDDPDLLSRGDGKHSNVVTKEEKTRWVNRLSNPAWYACDWSSGEIVWDGTFGPGTVLWQQGYCHAEGINRTVLYYMSPDVRRTYRVGNAAFMICVSKYEEVAMVIQRVNKGY